MGRPPGRPPLYGEPVTGRLVVRITPTQRVELRRVAREHGVGVASVLRALIDERFNDDAEDLDERRVFGPKVLTPKG